MGRLSILVLALAAVAAAAHAEVSGTCAYLGALAFLRARYWSIVISAGMSKMA